MGAKRKAESDMLKSLAKKMKASSAGRSKPTNANVSFVKGRVTTGPQGPELKTVDLVAAGTAVTAAAPVVVSLLAAIAQGTSSTTRIGDRIHIKSINVKINTATISSAVGINSFIRWSLVLDKSPDNATATAGAIFANNGSNLTQLTVANLQRFQILRTGVNEVGFCTVTGPVGQTYDVYCPADIATRFPDATGEAVANGLYLVVTTNQAANATIDYDVRVRYTDA